MAFTLRQLEIFVEAAADQNFRKTADRLGISQPSVSNHIGALEQKTGGKLFERQRGAAARLSPLGVELLEEAKSLLRSARKVSTSDKSSQKEYTLRIAAGHYLLDHWIRPSLRDYYSTGDMPNIELISALTREDVASLVTSGEAEFGFYTGRPFSNDEVEFEVIRQVSVSLYATAQIVASVKDDAELIGRSPMIMPPLGSSANDWLLATLAKASIFPAAAVSRSQFPDVILELTLKGVGIAMLFDDEVSRNVASGRLARIPIDFEPGFRCMLKRKGHNNPRATQALAYLRRLLQQSGLSP